MLPPPRRRGGALAGISTVTSPGDCAKILRESDDSSQRALAGAEPGREKPVPQKTVKMYTLSTCSHCRAAKQLMKDLGVVFEFTDVDLLTGNARAAIMDEVRKLNPACSFPTIIIGDIVIVGNREDKIREALGL
jgi:glutaredoxin-like protein NrdH